jgi:hypothetical protein
MSAPSKASANQLDSRTWETGEANPTRVTANPRHGTDPYA